MLSGTYAHAKAAAPIDHGLVRSCPRLSDISAVCFSRRPRTQSQPQQHNNTIPKLQRNGEQPGQAKAKELRLAHRPLPALADKSFPEIRHQKTETETQNLSSGRRSRPPSNSQTASRLALTRTIARYETRPSPFPSFASAIFCFFFCAWSSFSVLLLFLGRCYKKSLGPVPILFSKPPSGKLSPSCFPITLLFHLYITIFFHASFPLYILSPPFSFS